VSDYLSDEEQLARLKSWWQRYGTSLVAGALVAVVAVGVWRWYQADTEKRIHAASDLYASYLLAGDQDRPAIADQIVNKGSGTAYPTFVLFDQAARVLADGDAAEAEALLRRALQQASGAPLADAARLRLARILFDLGREEEALAELGGIRTSGFRGAAAELKGDIHLARGERALAHEAYVAAVSYVQAGEQRPVLEMKIADTSDASDT
jgi:predicted negative regulator of RcsB-dependent stress response